MYKVFIVDDEMIVRDGLRKKIDWDNSNFSFAGEAGDGEIALSMIQDIKPDILITDICMPFMDGLELAKSVKKIQPWIRIIILSGHDEFDYAKSAISIGVEEYILKPFIPEEIVACLNKIASSLDAEKKNRSSISKMKNELELNAEYAKEKMLTDLVYGNLDTSSALQKASEMNIALLSHYYMVSVSEIHSKTESLEFLAKARECILDLMKDKDELGFFISPTTYVSIVRGAEKNICEENAYTVAEYVRHQASNVCAEDKNGDVYVITAIGCLVEHCSDITKSFQDAYLIQKQCRFSDKSRVISSNDFCKVKDDNIVLQENDPLVDRLNYADESEIDQIINEYIALLGENTGSFSIIASYLLVDVIMAVSKVIEGLGGNVKDIMPDILRHSFVENAVQSQEVFVEEVRRTLINLLDYRNSNVQGRYVDVILKAKKYIENNYSNPDICLKSTAEAVHFSPNHFSTVFSQDCGITFIEYLTSVRIEQAKKMLKLTDKKSSDIAYEVGFNDSHYFSFIFKKLTGLTPREWRNSSANL